ncbi:MAG: hypothetical protein JWO55_476 [Candidatus Saccharibacteria bacterium]|jgi:hypothetical protein|nr:hypothetical protein [Candidatus Saccharibacteria bacterium]
MANANAIINDEMTLEEKLAAIDLAMKNAQEMANDEAISKGLTAAPIDPQDFLMCEGCQ